MAACAVLSQKHRKLLQGPAATHWLADPAQKRPKRGTPPTISWNVHPYLRVSRALLAPALQFTCRPLANLQKTSRVRSYLYSAQMAVATLLNVLPEALPTRVTPAITTAARSEEHTS